jgi:hypothetical protein
MFYYLGIRSILLESENHECPTCHETSVSPDTLIPNRYLRTSVNKFKNDTGYSRERYLRHNIPKESDSLAVTQMESNQLKVNDEEKGQSIEDKADAIKLEQNIEIETKTDPFIEESSNLSSLNVPTDKEISNSPKTQETSQKLIDTQNDAELNLQQNDE